MKKLSLAALAAVSAFAVAAPAAASILVLGGSVGYPCYQAARAKSSSQSALDACNYALRSGALNAHDEMATYVNRGVVKLLGGNHSDAIADFDRAMKLDPSEPEIYLNRGSALLRMGASATEAVAMFDQALRLETKRPELAYFSRAIAHEVTGDAQAAYLDYRRAQQAAPEWERPAQELSRFTVRRASGSTF